MADEKKETEEQEEIVIKVANLSDAKASDLDKLDLPTDANVRFEIEDIELPLEALLGGDVPNIGEISAAANYVSVRVAGGGFEAAILPEEPAYLTATLERSLAKANTLAFHVVKRKGKKSTVYPSDYLEEDFLQGFKG